MDQIRRSALPSTTTVAMVVAAAFPFVLLVVPTLRHRDARHLRTSARLFDFWSLNARRRGRRGRRTTVVALRPSVVATRIALRLTTVTTRGRIAVVTRVAIAIIVTAIVTSTIRGRVAAAIV